MINGIQRGYPLLEETIITSLEDTQLLIGLKLVDTKCIPIIRRHHYYIIIGHTLEDTHF